MGSEVNQLIKRKAKNMTKFYVIYKQAGSKVIEHQTFDTLAEAETFQTNAIAEGCEAVIRTKKQ